MCIGYTVVILKVGTMEILKAWFHGPQSTTSELETLGIGFPNLSFSKSSSWSGCMLKCVKNPSVLWFLLESSIDKCQKNSWHLTFIEPSNALDILNPPKHPRRSLLLLFPTYRWEKLRHRVTASNWQIWDLNPFCRTPESTLFNLIPHNWRNAAKYTREEQGSGLEHWFAIHKHPPSAGTFGQRAAALL